MQQKKRTPPIGLLQLVVLPDACRRGDVIGFNKCLSKTKMYG